MADPDLSRRIVYDAAGMTDVDTLRRIVYKREDDTDLLMDVYRPRGGGPGLRRPAIVFVHGGPIPKTMLPPREWGFFVSYGELAAASGLVGVVLNHRLHDITDYDRALGDLSAGIDHVRRQADTLGVDADRLALWVFSGGGPLLAEFLRTQPPYIRCVVAFYALLDLRPFLPPDADATRRERAARLSPAMHVRAARLPIFVGRAGLDGPLVNNSIDAFVAEALSANAPLDLMNHSTGHHAFDVLDDDERSRAIIGRALGFVQPRLSA